MECEKPNKPNSSILPWRNTQGETRNSQGETTSNTQGETKAAPRDLFQRYRTRDTRENKSGQVYDRPNNTVFSKTSNSPV